jgi:hypothetical protein
VKFDSRSVDAFRQVDLAVGKGRISDVAPRVPAVGAGADEPSQTGRPPRDPPRSVAARNPLRTSSRRLISETLAPATRAVEELYRLLIRLHSSRRRFIPLQLPAIGQRGRERRPGDLRVPASRT